MMKRMQMMMMVMKKKRVRPAIKMKRGLSTMILKKRFPQ